MFKKWKENAKKLLPDDSRSRIIISSTFGVLEYLTASDWAGACHATSAVLHVILKEQGVDSELCIGEVRKNVKTQIIYTDHSWILIDGLIYDIAIYKPLDPVFAEPITFKS